MSDADVPRDPWGNPVPEGVRPPVRPPAPDAVPAAVPAAVPPPPPPPPAPSPTPDTNPAWPGRSASPPATPPAPTSPSPIGGPPPPRPATSWPAPPPAARPRAAGTAIAALICGIVSIPCTGFLGIVLGPTAIGLGLAARRSIGASNGWRTGEGMATAGLVCGIVGTVVSIVYLVFLIRNPSFVTDFLNDLTTTTTTGKLQGA